MAMASSNQIAVGILKGWCLLIVVANLIACILIVWGLFLMLLIASQVKITTTTIH